MLGTARQHRHDKGAIGRLVGRPRQRVHDGRDRLRADMLRGYDVLADSRGDDTLPDNGHSSAGQRRRPFQLYTDGAPALDRPPRGARLRHALPSTQLGLCGAHRRGSRPRARIRSAGLRLPRDTGALGRGQHHGQPRGLHGDSPHEYVDDTAQTQIARARHGAVGQGRALAHGHLPVLYARPRAQAPARPHTPLTRGHTARIGALDGLYPPVFGEAQL